jgi:hypothetical protein
MPRRLAGAAMGGPTAAVFLDSSPARRDTAIALLSGGDRPLA